MNFTKRKVLSYLIGLFLVGIMGCDDDRGLQEAAPRIDLFYVGGSDSDPNPEAYADTPAEGMIEIDFGIVSVPYSKTGEFKLD